MRVPKINQTRITCENIKYFESVWRVKKFLLFYLRSRYFCLIYTVNLLLHYICKYRCKIKT